MNKENPFFLRDGDNGTGWYWIDDWIFNPDEQQKYGPYEYKKDAQRDCADAAASFLVSQGQVF